MKFTFLLFACFALHINALSQITVTNEDIAPAGTTFHEAFDTIPGDNIVPGDAGPNQVWTFTDLNNHGVDTIIFVLPEWTPFAADFPDANFAVENTSDNGIAYLIRNDDEFSNIGLAAENEDYGFLLLDVQPKEVFLDFPVQYGDTREEDFFFSKTMESSMTGIDSVRIKRSTHKSSVVDAFGTMTVNIGTYDVLRILEDRVVHDSIWVKALFIGWTLFETSIDTTKTYSWITDDVSVGYSLFSMDVNPITSIVSEASYLLGLPTGITVNNAIEAVAYPNPANGIVNMKLEKGIDGQFKLIDINGRAVLQKKINDDRSSFSVDLVGLPSGIYYYRITEQHNGKTINSGQIVVL